MTKLELIELIVLAVVALGLGIFYLVKAIKNGWLKKLRASIEHAIYEAEKAGLSGEAKKKLVLNEIEATCNELGIPYAFMKSVIDKLVEQIVKNYNVIKKGK